MKSTSTASNSSAKKGKEPKLFTLPIESKNPAINTLMGPLKAGLEKAFALSDLNQLYRKVKSVPQQEDFATHLLNQLHVKLDISEEDLARIPKTGKVILVANHPFGGIEGVVLCSLFSKLRADGKIMANFLLERIPDLAPNFIFVDPFGGESAARSNLKGMRQSIAHVQEGGLLGVFPSGTVSYYHPNKRLVEDPEWSPSIGKIIRKTEATVVPVYFDGSNGLAFQLLGLIHPRLRTVLLPRQFANKKGVKIKMRVGKPQSWSELNKLNMDDTSLMSYLKARTYALSLTCKSAKSLQKSKPTQFESIEDSLPLEYRLGELESLPKECHLLSSGSMDAYIADQQQIPAMLHEIGIERERTFRICGEGTGKSIDVDEYDARYKHLFIWDRDQHKLVGAYRIGQTDKLHQGTKRSKLYTETLFSIQRPFFDKIGPALELGRSFVVPEYQKSFSPLLMLWKGISIYVSRNPKYKILFGPVSISNEYSLPSRQLMVEYLKKHAWKKDLSRFVDPKYAFQELDKFTLNRIQATQLMDDAKKLAMTIADVDGQHEDIPILLKQYLKLGGQIAAFNVDPDFNYALDGLIVVDMVKADPAQIKRYMGEEAYRTFVAYHQEKSVA